MSSSLFNLVDTKGNNAFSIEEDFKPLYSSNKRYFFISGGRGSLKSHSLHDWAVRLTFTPNEGVLFTRYTMTAAYKSIIPEFKKAIDRLGFNDLFDVTQTHIINKLTKSFIWFTGIKTSSGSQTGNLKSLSGVTNWIVEEAEDFQDESEFNRINKSIRSKHTQNRVILVMNPTTKDHFLYKKWFEDYKDYKSIDGFDVLITKHPKVQHIHTTYLIATDYLDKEWLYEAYEARTKAKKGINPTNKKTLTQDEKKKAKDNYINEYLGGWRERAEGIIFDDWVIGKFDESLPYLYGGDYGFAADPSTIVKVAVDEKIKTIYIKEELYAKHLTTDQLKEAYEKIVQENIIVCDSAELRLINDLRNSGINAIPTIKKAGSVVAGIQRLQSYKLVVCGDSQNIIKELCNYAWIDKGTKSIPVDDYNHILDALRYVLEYLNR